VKLTKSILKELIEEELLSEKRWMRSWHNNRKGATVPKNPELLPILSYGKEGYDGKHVPWLTDKKAEKIFKYFHLSRRRLGKETFVFNPRVPKTPMDAEDDFTKRVSLAPTIDKAYEALGVGGDFHVYAGDVKSIDTDDIETISLKAHFPKCPKSKKNPYGENFLGIAWLLSLSDEELSPLFREYKVKKQHYLLFREIVVDALPYHHAVRRRGLGAVSRKALKKAENDPKQHPLLNDLYNKARDLIKKFAFGGEPKKLPKSLRDMFKMCVPDAKKTNEFWVTKNVELIYLGRRSYGDGIELSQGARIYLNALLNK
jgi:hypothetical protein